MLLIATACGAAPPPTQPTTESALSSQADSTDGDVAGAATVVISDTHPDGWAGVLDVPTDVYDPVASGEATPEGFRQLLRRDLIAPVYTPTFVRSDMVDWPLDEMVIGVDLNGEARAYPVGFLTRREIVVDLHRGIPTLVTW